MTTHGNDAESHRGPLIIGKSARSITIQPLLLPTAGIESLFFYVDNVGSDDRADDLKTFVQSLSVRLVSCQTKSNRDSDVT